MASQRSHAHTQLGQQLYPVLEQCRKPEVLWAKLATGRYDWLGVRRNGKYVLGRPRLSAVVPEEPAAPPPDDARDLHRIECLGPLQRTPRWESYTAATRPATPSGGWWRVTRSPRCRARGSGGRDWCWTAGRSRSGLVVRPLPRLN
jgi:hypothetical protein